MSFVMHEAHCKRNFTLCECGEALAIADKDGHRCPLQDVECECGATVNAVDREAHMQEMHQMVTCPDCSEGM
jgi:hypothetical protein